MQDRITPDDLKAQVFAGLAADDRLSPTAKRHIGACYLAAKNGEDFPGLTGDDDADIRSIEAWARETGWGEAAETHLAVAAVI